MDNMTKRPTEPGPKRLLFLCLFCLISAACFSRITLEDRFYIKRGSSFQVPRNIYTAVPHQTDTLLNLTAPTSGVVISVNVSSPTSAKHSSFTVRPVSGYNVCSTLEIMIEARNSQNELKPYGGDYFWTWLRSPDLNASAATDEIIDHQNGTYTARFQLHWAGRVDIGVSLVLSSEAVATLTRVRNEYPARCSYEGQFKKGNISMTTTCDLTTKTPLPPLEQSINEFCDFTDNMTGFPWYCVKPTGLPCDAYAAHAKKQSCGQPLSAVNLSQQESELNLRPHAIPSVTKYIQVDVAGKNNPSLCISKELPPCSTGLRPRPPNTTTGYYFKDEWHSMVCRKRKFDLSEMRKCLQNRRLHFWGDSTLRQWYEYFARDAMKETMVEKKGANVQFGPHVAIDKQINISLFYRHHGYPIRVNWTPIKDILHVPNMIDALTNDSNEVILLTLWAHFTASNLEYYRQRWYQIRAAIIRLKLRNPGVRIFIKSANTRGPTSMEAHDWFANQLDITMREIMTSVDGVTIIDVWDMTIGHRTGYRIHPKKEIISQEIAMLLSFLCPDMHLE